MVTKQAVRTEIGAARSRRAALLGAASALIGAGAAQAAAPGALPQDPTVVGGAATFSHSGQSLTVNQSTNRTVIDWRSFDIGAGAQTTFNQPGASAIAVNRINAGTDPTHIDGALRANGQVWILNPNGVMFGKGAVVNVAGLVASTANLDASRFMAGDNRLSFTGADRGLVTNDGAITVADNGLAAFVAPSVRNSGSINARVGKVTLAAGSTFTLDLAGDRLVEIGLGAGHAVVDQSGAIVDEGGVVTLSARSAGQVVDSVINMSGVVSTASARVVGGQIVLEGDRADVAGTLDASGTSGGRIALAANSIGVAPQALLRADSMSNGDGGAISAIAAVQGDYAGTYSARGGPSGGAGGKIETSGKTVRIADGIAVDTRAPAGAMGSWTIDPDNLTIGATGAGTISGGGVNSEDVTIGAGTVVAALNTSSVILQANTSISVNAAIDASAQANSNTLTLKDQNLDGQLTINLNAPITLGAHQHLAGMANVVNLTDSGLIQNAIDVASASGATVNVGAGNYEPGATINKSNLALIGTPGLSEIDVNPGSSQLNAITIAGNTSGVTVEGFKIVGEITGSYVNYAFGSGISRGVFAAQGATGFTISNNDIRNVRNGILIDGRNVSGATVANNLIDNTKSAISVQYTDATGISIAGNQQGPFGNEWGENLHLNGTFNGSTVVANSTGDASPTVQAALLAAKAANNGWSVQDQGYATSNRTNVLVTATGSDSNQGSPRAPLASIQTAISAVVAGGEIDVANGTYVSTPSTGYINVSKPLALIGQSQAGVIIDARNGQQYGLRVTAPSNVTLRNLTVWGVTTSGGYGVKIETINGLNVSNLTSQGAYKSEFDLNSVTNGVLDHLTANGAPVGGGTNTGGNGISISDSQNVTLTNSTTVNNGWGGLALYQTNSGPGAGLLQEKNITVAASNSFSESVPVYAEDTSTLNDFGTLNIGGFPYIVRATTNPADVVTVFQPTQQAAIDYAVSVSPTTAWIQGYGSGIVGNNVFTVGVGSTGAHQTMSIISALKAAQSGATVNVNNGTYVIPGGGGSYLLIDKSLSLVGQSQDGVIIDARSADTYAVRVAGTVANPISNVTLENLTFYGVPTGTGYGVKVEGVNGLTLSNITSQGAAKSEFDLNGVVGGTLDHLTANGAAVTGGAITGGNGISISDSQNLTLTNSTTVNNGWGGLALYQTNRSNGFPFQVTNITVDGANTFTEANPVYLEDQSATNNYGALNIAGFNYVVKAPNDPTDVYTWFQKTQQGAIDLAAAQPSATGTVQTYGGSGSAGDNAYIVGIATGGQAMSIKAALDAAQSGATVNVNNGTYVIPAGGTSYLGITKSLTLVGQSQDGTVIDASGATAYGLRVQADGVTLGNFTLKGSKLTGGYGIKVEPSNLSDPNARVRSFAISNVTIDGATKNTLDLNGALGVTIDNVTAKNAVAGNGIALIDSANVAISNSTTSDNAWGGLRIEEKNASFNQQTNAVTVAASNSFTEASPVYLEDDSASQDFGAVNVAGFGYAVKAPSSPADVYTWLQKTQQGAIDFAVAQSASTGTVQSYSGSGFGDNAYILGVATGGQALSIQTAVNAAQAGGTITIAGGTYGQSLTANARLNYIFAGPVTLGGFTLQSGASGSGLSGSLTASAITLGSPITLLGDLALNTRAVGGAITTGAIDASTAGGQSLTLDAGGGTISIGSLGASTRLGGVQSASATTLTGGAYNAASLSFGGGLILTSNLTTLDTSAANGAITTGAIDASTAGGQALTLNAGGGTISIGSLGSSTRLGAVQASGATTLTGGAYNAASLGFGGDVVLTAGQTTINTAPTAGNITVAGTLRGSSDGAQSIVLAAGSGSGGANGDISLQNVGAKTLRLNNLTVFGDDFGAQTVDIAGNFTAKLAGNQVFSSHTLNAGGQVNSTVGGNASGPINAGQSVNFAVAGDLTGAIAGTDVALNAATLTNAAVTASQSAAVTANTVSGSSVAALQNVSLTATTVNASSVNASQNASVNATSMAGSTVAATQAVNVNANSVSNSTLSANQTVTLSANQVQGSNLSASQAVNLSATTVTGSSLTAPTVQASANTFSGSVNASNSASVTGGDISGTFSGGSFKIAGTGAVNANVTAASLSVDTPKGTVTGSWQSLDTGSSGRAVSVNNQPVNVQGSGVSANQIVVENFALPATSTVTKTGEIILPQGQLIAALSPGGPSGAPKLIEVQSVQQLGSLLSEGYTAIVIDLSGHEKAPEEDKPVKVSAK